MIDKVTPDMDHRHTKVTQPWCNWQEQVELLENWEYRIQDPYILRDKAIHILDTYLWHDWWIDIYKGPEDFVATHQATQSDIAEIQLLLDIHDKHDDRTELFSPVILCLLKYIAWYKEKKTLAFFLVSQLWGQLAIYGETIQQAHQDGTLQAAFAKSPLPVDLSDTENHTLPGNTWEIKTGLLHNPAYQKRLNIRNIIYDPKLDLQEYFSEWLFANEGYLSFAREFLFICGYLKLELPSYITVFYPNML